MVEDLDFRAVRARQPRFEMAGNRIWRASAGPVLLALLLSPIYLKPGYSRRRMIDH